MTAAERIQPEQDYADKIADEFLRIGPTTDEGDEWIARDLMIRTIRSTLREEGQPGWALLDKSGHMVSVAIHRPAEDYIQQMERWGYTVRRVLVLFSDEQNRS